MAGKGGKRPGSGRKPSTIKGLAKRLGKFDAELILSEINDRKQWKELGAHEDPNVRLKALIYLTDRAHGKAAQQVIMNGNLTIDPGERAQRLAEIAARISAQAASGVK